MLYSRFFICFSLAATFAAPASADPGDAIGAVVTIVNHVTGIAAKPTYSIRTPVASITVRGTVFDVYIEGDEAIWILLHEGAVTVCNTAGTCRGLNEPCRMVRIGPRGAMPDPGTWNALPHARSVSFETAFPLVVKPPSIDLRPIFSREDIELGRCPEPKARKVDCEPDDTPAKPKGAAPRGSRQTYARPRYRYPRYRYPRSTPVVPNISIGIGGGGGNRGGGHYR